VDQRILPFVFEAAPQPMDLTAFAGLALVSETMLALGLDEVVRERLPLRARQRGYDEFDKLHALVLVQAAGGDCVEGVRILARDAGLVRLLARPLPSPDALHDFLSAFHDEAQFAARPAPGVAWIPDERPPLGALAAVNTALVHRAVRPIAARHATLDLDATIIESHKRDALAHYKGGRGYQPTAVVWAEQDLVVADQYRDGNVPAGMDTLAVARRAVAALPATARARAFRGDSACYDEALLKYLVREQIGFTISADLSPELRTVCADPAVEWTLLEERLTETVRVAEVEFTPGRWPKDATPLRYVVLEIRSTQGTLFAEPLKYLAVVSNREKALGPAALVRWHWEKAGTIEFVHDVSKNDLAASAPSQWQVRRQRGVVSADPPHVQCPHRAAPLRVARAVSSGPPQAPAVRGLHRPRRDPYACAASPGPPWGAPVDGRRTRRRAGTVAGPAHDDPHGGFRPTGLERFSARPRPLPASSQVCGVAHFWFGVRSPRGLKAFLGQVPKSQFPSPAGQRPP
jgi:DDE family transposase